MTISSLHDNLKNSRGTNLDEELQTIEFPTNPQKFNTKITKSTTTVVSTSCKSSSLCKSTSPSANKPKSQPQIIKLVIKLMESESVNENRVEVDSVACFQGEIDIV
ncbi:hypothetical protein Droror1_Dr00024083 [Drosera rotundifolia]